MGIPTHTIPGMIPAPKIHADLFERARPAFEKTRRELSAFRDLAIVNDIGSPLGLIASNDEQADEVERAIAPLLDEFPDMHVVRNSIYFRFAHVDYHKGSCLGMIASEERIAPEQCFAAGDHHNDVPMLDRKYAHAIACPWRSQNIGNTFGSIHRLHWVLSLVTVNWVVIQCFFWSSERSAEDQKRLEGGWDCLLVASGVTGINDEFFGLM
jgi:hypothetical protein